MGIYVPSLAKCHTLTHAMQTTDCASSRGGNANDHPRKSLSGKCKTPTVADCDRLLRDWLHGLRLQPRKACWQRAGLDVISICCAAELPLSAGSHFAANGIADLRAALRESQVRLFCSQFAWLQSGSKRAASPPPILTCT